MSDYGVDRDQQLIDALKELNDNVMNHVKDCYLDADSDYVKEYKYLITESPIDSERVSAIVEHLRDRYEDLADNGYQHLLDCANHYGYEYISDFEQAVSDWLAHNTSSAYDVDSSYDEIELSVSAMYASQPDATLYSMQIGEIELGDLSDWTKDNEALAEFSAEEITAGIDAHCDFGVNGSDNVTVDCYDDVIVWSLSEAGVEALERDISVTDSEDNGND